jgi:hypothetical protein
MYDVAMLQPKRTLRRRVLRRVRALLVITAIGAALLSAQSRFTGLYVTQLTDAIGPTSTFTTHQRALQSSGGRLWCAYMRIDFIDFSRPYPRRWRWMAGVVRTERYERIYEAPWRLARIGIDWRLNSETSPLRNGQYIFRELFFSIPYWLIVSASVALRIVLEIRPWIERRRMRKNLCPGCAYDIRATPDHCPECGLGIA